MAEDPNLEADALIAELGGGTSASAVQAPAPAATDEDPNDLADALLSNVVLPQTGELRSPLADGTSPGNPILKSPLDPADRLKLAVGNRKGNVQYLKSKFDNVYETKDGRTLVEKDGLWFDTDPSGDAWETTKGLLKAGAQKLSGQKLSADANEALGDAAEALPTVATIGASVGAGIATGGASLVAQGAAAAATGALTAGLRTSLGRAVDTYEADPQEQLADIGLEALLNVGGVLIPAGVKPTGRWIGQHLGNWSRSLSGANPEAKVQMINTMAMVMGKEADDVARAASRGAEVGSVLSQHSTTLMDQTVSNINRAMTQDVKEIAKSAPKIMNSLWDDGIKEAEKLVPANFKANPSALFQSMKSDALENGFLGFKKGSEILTGAEARAALESGAKGKLVVQTRKDVAKFLNAKGEGFAIPDEVYGKLQGFLGDVLEQEGRIAGKAGKDGFRQMMNLKRTFADMTWDLRQSAQGESDLLFRKFSEYGKGISDSMDKALRAGLDDTPLAQRFRQLNVDYGTVKSQLGPLNRTLKNAEKAGTDEAFETFKNHFVSKPSRQEEKKKALEIVVDLQEKYGGKARSLELRKLNDALLDKKAALAFIPKSTGGLISGMTARPIARAQLKATQLLNKGGLDMLETFKKIGPSGMRRFMQDPALAQGVVRSWLETPVVKQQLETELLNRGKEQVFGGGDNGP